MATPSGKSPRKRIPYSKPNGGSESPFKKFEKDRSAERENSLKKHFKNTEKEKKPMETFGNKDFDKKSYPARESGGYKKEFSKSNNTKPAYNKKKDAFDSAVEKFESGKITSKAFSEKPVTAVAKTNSEDGIRLNKFLANSGVAARRKADELIKEGAVTVNGAVVTEMGFKVQHNDVVKFQGKIVKPTNKVYILLNKPKDFITTTDDEKGRKTVLDIVKKATPERIYPVGRLDRNTTGLLLLTNDGDLAQKLSHPSFNVKKIYAVELDKPLKPSDYDIIKSGVELEEGMAQVDDIQYVEADNKRIVGIEIHMGWNRIVRRIFETLGYEILKLDRVMYAGLTKKDLPRGRCRHLSEREVIALKHFLK
jgi:23S rRNA pseudouridine2605 synthase